MNFFDDIRMRVEQAVNNESKNINDYIRSNVVEPMVKVGMAATGNLSEQQIKDGQKGQAQPLAATSNSVQVSAGLNSNLLLVLAAAGAAYFIFKGGKK